jgi:hypothetical protein
MVPEAAGVSLCDSRDRERTQSEWRDDSVGIASLGDSEVPLLVAAGMLPGHQSDPRRKLPPVVEASPVCNGCYHGCCSDWADAFHGCDLLAERVASMNLLNLLFQLVDALFQGAEFLVRSGQKLSPKSAQ